MEWPVGSCRISFDALPRHYVSLIESHPAGERQQMDQRGSAFLHTQFEAQAERTPDKVALRYRDATITFRELEARASRVASRLHARGLTSGAMVGLHVERSIDYVVALLGILKANCAVVPLPPTFPEARLRDILAFASLDAVIDDDRTPLDRSWTRQVVRLSEASSDESGTSRVSAPMAATPDQPAFVLCSSGSTGVPKLIVRSHQSFFHRLRWTWEHLPYEAGEVCVQKAHMTTTHAIYELFEPLLRGIPLHIITDQEARDLESFWETILARGVSRLLMVPSVLQASLEMPGFVPPPLAVLVLMGEHVPRKLAGRALEVFRPPTKIFSIYGSTEASSTLVCDVRASYRPEEELPLGKPVSPDVAALVMDDALAPTQPGDVGMLYISGPALFSSYFKAPESTAATLVSATERGGERLYRTQDRVRVLPDANLQFIGRVDDTVKIRGFRVDLGEVERAVRRNSAIRQCVVLASADDKDNATLVAFVTPATVAPSAVLQTAGESLPNYMIPGVVVALDSFPLTSSGKIDRRRLLEEFARSSAGDGSSGHATTTEQRVADIWRQVLGHGSFAARTSFFEAGGTSLNVFAAVHRLRAAFTLSRAQLSDVSIYRYPTLSALAAYIEAVRGGRSPAAAQADSILVTLKRGAEPNLPPLFLIASAGGTLGAYDKLAKALGPRRDVVGVRDPFLWSDRDPTQGFHSWVRRYVEAIQGRQKSGPYHIAAYSSAGAFGYEIARQLRLAGEKVALLALIDPLSLDRGSKARFGYWALDARFSRLPFMLVVLLAGWLRRALPAWVRERGEAEQSPDWKPDHDEFLQVAQFARNNPGHVRNLSALFELNTGLPFALTGAELAAAGPDGCVGVWLEKVRSVAPETDLQTMENIVVQYELQVRSQHKYELRRYDGRVALFEPEGRYRGLESAQLRPYVKDLRTWGLEVGAPSDRVRALAEVLPARIRTHYLCMRDDLFTTRLASELDNLIEAGA